MTINSYDVEEFNYRPLTRWVAGSIASFTGVLAIIGWPLPILSGRYAENCEWEQTRALIDAWLKHAGWRMSGSSWFWGGVSIAAIICVILTLRRQEGTGLKEWLLVLVPGGIMATLGPLLQLLLGAPWSNYTTKNTSPIVLVYLATLVVVIGLLLLRGWVARRRNRCNDVDSGMR